MLIKIKSRMQVKVIGWSEKKKNILRINSQNYTTLDNNKNYFQFQFS